VTAELDRVHLLFCLLVCVPKLHCVQSVDMREKKEEEVQCGGRVAPGGFTTVS